MSYQEALEDNISIGKDKYGFEVYYPECHICGAPVTTWTYKKGMKITCPKCRSFFSAVRKAGNNFLATEKGTQAGRSNQKNQQGGTYRKISTGI